MSERVAWLAGLLDGEGSVGCARSVRRTKGGDVPGSLIPAVQLAMTCEETVAKVAGLMTDLGCRWVGHHHQERDPSRHRDAYYLRVSRWADVERLARLMLPYSVTKRRHWALLLELAERRLECQAIDDGGRVRYRSKRPYDAGDLALVDGLRRLNLRGPRSRTER